MFACLYSFGKKHKRERGLPRTEVGLMNNVLGCLSNKDTMNYYNLFIPFDTLWQLVLHNPDHSPEATRQLNNLKEHPRALLEFDPAYNPAIMGRFVSVLKKGEDSGIHWKEIVMQRYELHKEDIVSHTQKGYDLISPERYMGYMFVRDLLGRTTFCISIAEIQKVNGFFFGGQVLNILEANSIDQFLLQEAQEQKYFAWLAEAEALHADSLKNGLIDTTAKDDSQVVAAKVPNPLGAEANEEDTLKKRREVVDRRYYEGKFDEEIPVKLYVRYMKDLRTNNIVAYDGLYKFGDQVQYAKLNITRSKDGTWTFEDDPPIGTMELELKAKVYTGSWTNNENQTGYDVVLTQTDIATKKLEQLDKMLESGQLGRVDGETGPAPKSPAEPVIEGMENNPDTEQGSTAEKPVARKKKKTTSDDDEKPKKVKKPRTRDDSE
jgi:hypothetical protein